MRENPLCPNGCGNRLTSYAGMHFGGYESLECVPCKEAGKPITLWEVERVIAGDHLWSVKP